MVACSTGEEAYTLAILFSEYAEQMQKKVEVKIYATDVDRDAVEKAGTGYPIGVIFVTFASEHYN